MIALQDGRAEDAVSLIGQAIAASDRVAAYHAGIAEAYGMLGRRTDALTHYRKAVEIEPGQWAALHQLSALLLERGEANKALEYAKRALTWKDSEAGRALFVTSGAARKHTQFWGGYAMSKAALESLALTYAAECESTRVRVNLFNPGATRTAMRKKAMPGEEPGTLKTPEDVAPRLVELLSPANTANGQLFSYQAS